MKMIAGTLKPLQNKLDLSLHQNLPETNELYYRCTMFHNAILIPVVNVTSEMLMTLTPDFNVTSEQFITLTSQVNKTPEHFTTLTPEINKTSEQAVLFGSNIPDIIVQITILAICLLLSVGGNSLIIVTVIKDNNLHSTTYYIQLCLAIANFLSSLVNLPTGISVLSLQQIELPNVWCQLQGSINFSSGIGIMMLYTVTSLDRFMCILHPLKYSSSSWVTRPHIYITVIMVAVLVIGIIPLAKHSFAFHEGLMVCTLVNSFNFRNLSYVSLTGTVIFIICIVTLVITQVSMFLIARSKSMYILSLTHPLNQSSSRTLMALKAHIKALKPISFTILIFVLTWMAYSAIIIVDKKSNKFHNMTQFKVTSRVICMLFLTVPQFCNPIIYTIYDTKFYSAVTKLLHIKRSDHPSLNPVHPKPI